MVGAPVTGKARLRLEVRDLEEGALRVRVNGRVLEELAPEESEGWVVDLPAGSLVQGLNQVGLSLQKTGKVSSPPTVESVEVHVPAVLLNSS